KGSTRATLALNIMSGAEYRTNLINGYFLQFLKRLPTAAELSDLLAKFPKGAVSPTGFTDESALKTIASTMEYYQKFGTTKSLPPLFTSAVVGYGDFNGDGLLDKAVLDSTRDRINIYSGLPALQGGGFATTASKALQLPFGSIPRAVLVTDLNGDNHPDIL